MNALEINWKLGVHDLRSYTPLRVGVDDDVLRVCLEKKVACVYDSSGVASSVSEDALMNFCFSGKEVLRKAPNVTHARLMQGRRCLFIHLKALSAKFVKLFVQVRVAEKKELVVDLWDRKLKGSSWRFSTPCSRS